MDSGRLAGSRAVAFWKLQVISPPPPFKTGAPEGPTGEGLERGTVFPGISEVWPLNSGLGDHEQQAS